MRPRQPSHGAAPAPGSTPLTCHPAERSTSEIGAEVGTSARRAMALDKEVVAAIEEVTQEPEVRTNHDLPLFDLQVLDSLRTIVLMVELNARFGVDIAPSEIDREAW